MSKLFSSQHQFLFLKEIYLFFRNWYVLTLTQQLCYGLFEVLYFGFESLIDSKVHHLLWCNAYFARLCAQGSHKCFPCMCIATVVTGGFLWLATTRNTSFLCLFFFRSSGKSFSMSLYEHVVIHLRINSLLVLSFSLLWRLYIRLRNLYLFK